MTTEKYKTIFTTNDVFNGKDDQLPFGYYDPSLEGKLTWLCVEGEGEEKGKIMAVFSHSDHKEEAQVKILTFEEACFCRNELVKNGWRKIISPTVIARIPDND